MIQRLDKYLSDAGIGTRKEIKILVNKGRVTVDNCVVKDSSEKRDYSICSVLVDGKKVEVKKSVLCVLYKPAGYVTSTNDPLSPTVMELIPKEYRDIGLLPVGRLDKDTEGLLLFSNDGDFIHKTISPKSKIEKTYYARFEGQCPENAKALCEQGIVLKDKSVCQSAVFEKLSDSEFRITITQGMYHQVRRMAQAMGMHITFLKRESIGPYNLNGMKSGEFREL